MSDEALKALPKGGWTLNVSPTVEQDAIAVRANIMGTPGIVGQDFASTDEAIAWLTANVPAVEVPHDPATDPPPEPVPEVISGPPAGEGANEPPPTEPSP